MPGIIPEGMGLLAGGPKVGKSWLGYALSLAIARGADALGGIPTGTARPVLYLALEDGDRRMKERRQVLLGDEPTPENLHFVTLDGRPDEDGQPVRLDPAEAVPLDRGVARPLRPPEPARRDRHPDEGPPCSGPAG